MFEIYWVYIDPHPRLWYQVAINRRIRGRIVESDRLHPVPLLREAKQQAEDMVDPLVAAVAERRRK